MTKVISGLAKGLVLDVFPQKNLRPTSCRAKEALFDIIQFEIKDKLFLDLFSGTGQIGIEALSRGAKKVIFVEKSRESIRILTKNLNLVSKHCEKKFNYEIIFRDCLKFLDSFNQKADIVFADAPFDMMLTNNIFTKFTHVVKNSGTIITETLSRNNQIDDCSGFKLIRRYIYGKISLNFYKNIVEEVD